MRRSPLLTFDWKGRDKGMDIKRADLIQQLVDKHHYTKKAATSIVDDFCQIILDNLRNGNTVSIHDFGCFDILERKQRSCPNPQTGERVNRPLTLDSTVLSVQEDEAGRKDMGRQ